MADGSLPRPDTRKAALTALAELGAHFVLCGTKDGPKAAPSGWQTNRPSLQAVLRHKGLIGVIPASLKCVVVDVDRGGEQSADAVIAELGSPVVKAPSSRDGGWHIWYGSREADSIGNGEWRDGEIRGNAKGQAILWHPELVAEGLADRAHSLIDLIAVDLNRLACHRHREPARRRRHGRLVERLVEGERQPRAVHGRAGDHRRRRVRGHAHRDRVAAGEGERPLPAASRIFAPEEGGRYSRVASCVSGDGQRSPATACHPKTDIRARVAMKATGFLIGGVTFSRNPRRRGHWGCRAPALVLPAW